MNKYSENLIRLLQLDSKNNSQICSKSYHIGEKTGNYYSLCIGINCEICLFDECRNNTINTTKEQLIDELIKICE